MTAPITPLQAELQALFPPHVYFAMSPEAQATAWAQFVQAKQSQAHQAATRQGVNVLIVFLIMIPLIIGVVLAIIYGVAATNYH